MKEDRIRRFCLLLIALFTIPVSLSAATLPEAMASPFRYDSSQPIDLRDTVLKQAGGGGIKVHDITFASPVYGRVPAYLVVPAGNGPFPALLFGHWGNGTRTEFLPEAELYAEIGVVSLIIDYPWVRPAEWRKTVFNINDPPKDYEAYRQAVIDLRRGLDLLASLPYVDANRIGYIGHSYGAQWGAILTAVDRRIKATVLMGGVPDSNSILLKSNDPDMTALRKQVPADALNKYLDALKPLDAISFVPYAAPTPLLFQFARFERYFDEEAMNRYAAAAGEPKQVLWYDSGHDLNDVQTLIDRGLWMQKQLKLPKSIVDVIRGKLK